MNTPLKSDSAHWDAVYQQHGNAAGKPAGVSWYRPHLERSLHWIGQLTAGDTTPVVRALERMLAMRAYQREKHVDQRINQAVLDQVGISQAEVEEMYHVMAIANYEDRFVIPTTHREYAENAFNVRGGCGFSFGNGCSEGTGETSLFGSEKKRTIPIKAEV